MWCKERDYDDPITHFFLDHLNIEDGACEIQHTVLTIPIISFILLIF